jgi:OHCU decarboxylase
MAAARPYRDAESVADAADRTWRALSKEDWLEAFAAHPPIGGAAATGSRRARDWSEEEQSGTRTADSGTMAELAELNRAYAERFGRVFLVCATGKTAAEMIALGRRRLGNDDETELAVAAEEQRKITRIRLERILSSNER